MIKLGEGIVNHPEDVSVDGNGVLYTATGDGWIKRMHPNGTWEDWQQVGSQSLLGLTTTKENNVIIVCDSQQVRQLLSGFFVLVDFFFLNIMAMQYYNSSEIQCCLSLCMCTNS